MSSEQTVDKAVSSYLAKKGFDQSSLSDPSALALPELERIAKNPPSYSGRYLSHYNPENLNPKLYEECYSRLRRWIEDSLDLYKSELRQVLYPIFIHAYLDLVNKGLKTEATHFFDHYKTDHVELHLHDLQIFSAIQEPMHLQENELAQNFRNNKYVVRMSKYSFQLLISFLEDNNFQLLLKVVNQYINIQVFTGKPNKRPRGEHLGLLGVTANVDEFNSQTVYLGKLATDLGFQEEVEQRLKEHDKKRRTGEPSLVEVYQKVKSEAAEDAPPKSVPLPRPKLREVEAEIKAIRDLGHRVSLTSKSLPSICCYTFHNTYDTLTSTAMTEDATMLAAGFSESVVKVYSLTDKKLRAIKNNVNPFNLDKVSDLNSVREQHGDSCKTLVGHAGPVYGLSFTKDNRYMLSCSEDKTVRLWSMDTFSNLVCYRGHNYPVWDVDFGPEGIYFATASHDRTARLWSCEHIYPLRIFAGHLSDVDVVKFHPNSNYIATGSSDKTARLWDVQRGQCVRVFTGHVGPVTALAISPDGRTLATAAENATIHLFDLASGKRLKKYTGHKSTVYSLVFSKETSLLASSSGDCTVKIWDVKGSKEDEVGDMKMEIDGLGVIPSSAGGVREKKKKKGKTSSELLASFPTKATPIQHLQFTPRNLLVAIGPYQP
ncbi:WD40-repeat-containing domain protein [Paraphysoderma sedebokerense]|nr:WD40-repeat-containing domain protein [Paraphysoderma sedebokerense]